MTLEKRVANVKKVAEENGMTSFVKWAQQAEYMLKEYRGTKYEAQTVNCIESFLKKLAGK